MPGGQPGALLALLIAGNCCNPYPDTVGNGTTLRKSGIHDTQFDAKAPKPTPKNRKIDALKNSRSGRVGAALRRLLFHLLFFHTLFFLLNVRVMCAALSPLQTHFLVGEDSASIEVIPCSNALPLRALLGLLFCLLSAPFV